MQINESINQGVLSMGFRGGFSQFFCWPLTLQPEALCSFALQLVHQTHHLEIINHENWLLPSESQTLFM